MSTPAVRELHLVVGFDGSPPANRALDTAARLLSVRPPGRITVVWVAHLSSTVEMSADAVAVVENDFDQVAGEVRTAAAEDLVAVAESVQAARPDDVVVILVGSSSSVMHRMVGSVAVQLARHSPVPVTIVP
jgi:nucleotide-binding universal stress UspA family protein